MNDRGNMKTIIITGANGLVGSEAVRHFSDNGFRVVGIDNNTRQMLFGQEASTQLIGRELVELYPCYIEKRVDIRDDDALIEVFSEFSGEIETVVHCAAQPSHDWAARNPIVDFDINARGTLLLLENTMRYCPDASFIHMSTNKVYGDLPNTFTYEEDRSRWRPVDMEICEHGFSERLSIDASMHSLFGASKLAADILVQEYARYFGLNTVTLRGGCLTGPNHMGAELHGFLSYLVRCAATGRPYSVFGYKGKQVRDNLHSKDLVSFFSLYMKDPKPGLVLNIGGGVDNAASILEVIGTLETEFGLSTDFEILESPRKGDHVWYATDLRLLKSHYPEWTVSVPLLQILEEIVDVQAAMKLE